MRQTVNRRSALYGFGAAFTGTLLSAPLPQALLARRVAEGALGSFDLRRILVRGLSDGKAITVTRQWRCDMVPEGEIIRVSGEQIDVSVEAPEQLAPLAAIERRRKVTGLFPATINADGLLDQAHIGTAPEDITAAINAAMDVYAARGASAETRASAASFLSSLSQRSAEMISNVPPNLFFPTPGEQRIEREIVLPDGNIGGYSLVLRAQAEDETGMLKESSREVITRVEESERKSRESWEMTRA
jgi:hypothetical protein